MPSIMIPVPFTKSRKEEKSKEPQGSKRFDDFRLKWHEAYIEAIDASSEKLDAKTDKKIAKLEQHRKDAQQSKERRRQRHLVKIAEIQDRAAVTLARSTKLQPSMFETAEKATVTS